MVTLPALPAIIYYSTKKTRTTNSAFIDRSFYTTLI